MNGWPTLVVLLQTLINIYYYLDILTWTQWIIAAMCLLLHMTGCVHAWRKALKEGPGYRGQYWVKLCRFVTGATGFCAAAVNFFVSKLSYWSVECSTWRRNPWRSWWSRGAGTAKETTSPSSCSGCRWLLNRYFSQWVSLACNTHMPLQVVANVGNQIFDQSSPVPPSWWP